MKTEDRDIGLEAYLSEISRIPMLSKKGERNLAKKIEKVSMRRKIEERQRFAQANLRLVVSIAKKYASPAAPLLHLIQEGNIALLRAVDGFDWRIGRFSTYATGVIKKAIFGYLKDLQKKSVASLDAKSDGENKDPLYDSIKDEKANCPSNRACNDSIREMILKAIRILKPRAQRIISLAYGLEDGTMLSNKEIAKIVGITEQSVGRSIQVSLKILQNNARLADFNRLSEQ